MQQGDSIKAETVARLQLATEVGENRAEVEEVSRTVGGVMAEKTWRLNVNGHVAGMVARVDLDDQNAPVGEIGFTSDIFRIVAPDGSQTSVPFVHYATDRVIDGRTYSAGTYLENVFIGKGLVGRLQIQDVIQSDNYAEDASGTPVSGLKLNFRTGKIKAAGPVISRNIVVAEGSFWTGGQIAVSSALGLHQVESWELVATGVEVPTDQVWMASERTYIAYAAFDGEAAAPGSITGNNEYWGCKAEILPFARWNGPQQLYLNISLWAKGITSLHRRGDATKGGKIHWKIYEVT